MDFLGKRPAGAFASSFFVFACVLYCVGENVRLITAIVVLAVFAAVIVFGKFFSVKIIGKAAMAISAGVLAASLFSVYAIDVRLARITDERHENTEITGVVQSVVSRSSYSGCYIVKPFGESVLTESTKLYLTCDSGEFAVGDMIRCVADISPLEHNEDYKYSLYSDGVVLSADVEGEVGFIGRSCDVRTRFSVLRDRVSSRLTSEMSYECGGFSKALLLGDKSDLTADVTRDFRCLGISHILALSGTHLTVIFTLLGKFIPGKGKLRFVRFFAIFTGVLFYMALTGFSPSIVRSGIMFIISAAASALNRKADSFTSLSVAVLLICVISPFAPFDAGLQLSYAAVIGLIMSDGIQKSLCADRDSVILRVSSKVIPAVVVPSVLLPLLWLRFGEISLASPAANLLIVPVLVLILPMLLVLLPFSFIPGLFGALSSLVEFIISAMLGVVGTMAGTADFMLPLKGKAVFVVILFFGIGIVCTVMSVGKVRGVAGCVSMILLPIVLLTSQITLTYDTQSMNVYYASSGTDDAVTVMSDGYTVIVDIGMYQKAIMAAADRGNGMRIDALVLAHVHRNHKKTVEMLGRNHYLKSIWIPVPYSESSGEICEEIVKEAKSLGISVYSYVPGETVSFGDCRIGMPETERIDGSSHPEVKFSAECEDGALVYGSSRADVESISDNCVRIVGVHGHKVSGVLTEGDFSSVVLSGECADGFGVISESAVVSDRALICFDVHSKISIVTE